MKKGFTSKFIMLAVILCLMLPAAAMASDLTDFVRKLDEKARADLKGFKASLHAEFPVPGGTIELALSNADSPADAYMMLKVGEVSGRPVQEVVDVYRANKNRGWGYIAKQMGIKPGSAEFHALKGGSSGKSNGKKGKGKGKGKKRK